MEEGEQIFVGYVWSENEDSLIGVAIHRYTEVEPEWNGVPHFDVYFGDGDSEDEWLTAERFIQRFGSRLYNTVDDFKADDWIPAEKVLV